MRTPSIATALVLFLLCSTISPDTSAGKLGGKLKKNSKLVAAAGAGLVYSSSKDKKKQAAAEQQAAEEAAIAEAKALCPKPPVLELYGTTQLMVTDFHPKGGSSYPSDEKIVKCGEELQDADYELFTVISMSGSRGEEFLLPISTRRIRLEKGEKINIGECYAYDENGSLRSSNCERAGIAKFERDSEVEIDDAFLTAAHDALFWGSKEYMFMEAIWPAFDEYKSRVLDPNKQPNLNGKIFDRVCKNTFDKTDNNLAKRWQKSFGYERCGDNNENWYRFLSWFARDTKDLSSTNNWFNFSVYSEDELTLTVLRSREHAPIFRMVYDFTMYAAATLAPDDTKKVLLPHYEMEFFRSIKDRRKNAADLMDVKSLDDVKYAAKKIRSLRRGNRILFHYAGRSRGVLCSHRCLPRRCWRWAEPR